MISKEEEEGVETITFLGTLEEITEIQKEYQDYPRLGSVSSVENTKRH